MRAATPRLLFAAALLLAALPLRAQSVFINEIHYDNDGGDTAEGVEIAGPAGTDLSGYSIVLYNGANGETYGSTTSLAGLIPDQQNGYGTVNTLISGIQNGAPDGLALVGPSGVIQFLSYEGSFTADGGPADGMTSTDIGVFETDDPPLNQSLQLIGTGTEYGDFTWSGPMDATAGAVNTDQTFAASTPPECLDPTTSPSYAGGYVLNGDQSRAAIQTSTPVGGLVFEFYNTTNLAIEDPENPDTSNPPGFTRSGDTFTFDPSTPSPATLFFPITRADPNVARVSFFLRITDACGRTVDVDPVFAVTNILGESTSDFALEGTAPNPTTGAATIRFSLDVAGEATLTVYDVLGREVARLVDGALAAGEHEAAFDGVSLPSGLYLYRLTSGGQTLQKTLTVAR